MPAGGILQAILRNVQLVRRQSAAQESHPCNRFVRRAGGDTPQQGSVIHSVTITYHVAGQRGTGRACDCRRVQLLR